jgi:hypothetical protein
VAFTFGKSLRAISARATNSREYQGLEKALAGSAGVTGSTLDSIPKQVVAGYFCHRHAKSGVSGGLGGCFG